MSSKQDAQFALVGKKDRFRRGERLEDDLPGLHAGAVQATDERPGSRRVAHDQVDLGFQPAAQHPVRIRDAAVVVDRELLRNRVQDLPVGRKRHAPGGGQNQVDVGTGDPLVAAVDVGGAVAVRRTQIGSADADEGAGDLDARHGLRLLRGPLERAHRRVEVHDVAPQRAAVGRPPDADDLERRFSVDLGAFGDQHGDLRRPHVDGDHMRIRLRHPLRPLSL